MSSPSRAVVRMCLVSGSARARVRAPEVRPKLLKRWASQPRGTRHTCSRRTTMFIKGACPVQKVEAQCVRKPLSMKLGRGGIAAWESECRLACLWSFRSVQVLGAWTGSGVHGCAQVTSTGRWRPIGAVDADILNENTTYRRTLELQYHVAVGVYGTCLRLPAAEVAHVRRRLTDAQVSMAVVMSRSWSGRNTHEVAGVSCRKG